MTTITQNPQKINEFHFDNLTASDVRRMKLPEKAALIKACMAPFFFDGKVTELRILGVGGHEKRVDGGFFDNPDAFAAAAAKYVGTSHLYFTPNPVNPDLLARANNRVKEWVKGGQTTSDENIERRHWFLIDTDPCRPSGISATDEERDAALERLDRIVDFLSRCGWKQPIKQRSGNGGHGEYRIDLPNDDESRDLLSDCLQALSAMFSDEKVSVDVGNFNASRIWKVGGAISIKGDDIPNRPHRVAHPISIPDVIEIVPLEKLRELAKHAPQTPPMQKDSSGRSTGTFNLESWISEHIDARPKVAYKNGGVKWKLNKCYFSNDHTDGAYIIQNADGKIAAGCSHDRCDGKTWHDLRAMFDGTKEERKQRWIDEQDIRNVAESFTSDNAPLQREIPLTTVDEQPQGSNANKNQPQAPDKKSLSARIKADYASLGLSFALNECSQEIVVNGNVLDEPLAASIRVAMRDLEYTNVAAFEDVYIAEAGKNRFHPIKRYFDSLQWDKRDHILALSKYLEDSHESIPGPYDTARPVSHVWLLRWLIGAVAKVKRPGAQNAMLVLAGAQDAGKSTFARWLCSPLADLHEESSIDPENKEHVRKLASKFIWEVSELGATTRKADIESLKAFITKMDVTYRVPYSKHPVTVPATASFIGTINPTMDGFLNDETGSRRFMVMELTRLDWDYAKNIDINQVWAQAVALFEAGEPWRLTEPEVAVRRAINKAHEIVDPLEDFFHTYYEIDPALADDEDWRVDPTNIMEHLRYKNFKDSDRQLSTRMGLTLKRLGVDRKRISAGGVQVRVYAGIRLKEDTDKPKPGYERRFMP